MAVVINEFEASVEPSAGRPEARPGPAEIKPFEFRRQLRRSTLRALRIQAS